MNMTSTFVIIAKISLFFLVNAAVHAATSPASPDAATLLAEMNAKGAKQVIARLNSKSNPNAWDDVVKHIRSGQPAWLEVASELARDADAGSATDLKIALAHALRKNPGGVLKLAGSQEFLSVEEVCGTPFIEPTDRYLQHYLAQAKQAVANMRDRQLEAQQAACLAQLENAERQLRALRKGGR